ncbi:SGNH/GDSL hydrolase family protein [Candidatus Altiarchaeota archaeon]
MEKNHKEILLNVSILVIVLSLMSLAFELSLRYSHAKGRKKILDKQSENQLCTTYADDPRLIYTYIPGKCGANRMGYQDDEHDYEGSQGVYRIIVIGDSVAEGEGLSQNRFDRNETFPNIMEERLNKQGLKTEVIVLARSGYSTGQQLILLKEEALRYDPDLIIWSYVLNDPAHPVYHNANGEFGIYFHRPASYILDTVQAAFFHIREMIRERDCPWEYHAMLHCVYRDQVESDIREIGEIAGREDITVLFAINPIFQAKPTFKEYTLSGVHEELAGTASKAGLIPVDMLSSFADEVPAETHVSLWHPNRKGHRIIANRLVKEISDLT